VLQARLSVCEVLAVSFEDGEHGTDGEDGEPGPPDAGGEEWEQGPPPGADGSTDPAAELMVRQHACGTRRVGF